MDESKIIRVVLEARDGLSGVLAKAHKNVNKELDAMNRDFLKSRKGMDLLEQEYEDMTKSIQEDSRRLDASTKAIRNMTQALRDAADAAKRAKAASKETFAGFGGTTIRRGPDGRFKKEADSLNASLKKGYDLAKSQQKLLDQELGATKEIRKERLKAAEERNQNLRVERSIQQDIERTKRIDKAQVRIRPNEERLVDLAGQIAAERKKDEKNQDIEAQQRLENAYKREQKRIEAIYAEESRLVTRKYQKIRIADDKKFNLEKASIKSLDKDEAERIIKRFRDTRQSILREGTLRERIGKTVGFSVGDFFGGIKRGKSDVRDLDKDLEKLSSTFGRLGFAIGGAFKDLNNLVNLRWLFITSAITLLVNVLTQLVVVLVSVASSAILAGAALGGALVAGITQAVPVVGLLAAAFHQFQNVLKAVALEDKANVKSTADAKEAADKRTQALQKLADAHYAVKQSMQAVRDANYNLEQSHKDVILAQQNQTDAIKDLAKARREAARDIVDANQQEKDSALALEEAELAVLDAKEKLRKEQEKARRGSTDIDAGRAAVKEAQDRLALARQQGDAAEITKANQQLSIAKQNLDSLQDAASESETNLKDAEIGVKRAEINRQQAATKKKRDAEDAARLRKQGVEQSDRVLAAEKQLAQATKGIADAQHDVAQAQIAVANSIHQLAISRREEADAKAALADKTNLQSTAQKNLNEAIAQFSPAEKRLYQSLLRVKNAYKKAFSGTKNKDGILAPILDGFSAIADAITKILTDPQIIQSLGKLAKAIGNGFQRLAKLLTSKSFKEDLLFFIDQATDNLPKVFSILFSIFNLIRKIGKEAAPIFSDLVGGLDSLLGRANKAAGQKVGGINSGGRPEEGSRGPNAQQQTRLGKFFEGAEKHLKAWLALGKAIGRVIWLLTNVSAPTGKSLVESATDALNNLGDYIKENPEKVQKFFNDVADAFRDLATALLDLTKMFGKAAADPNIQNFALFLIKVIVPGIYAMITAVGFLFGALDKLTKIPLLGSFIKFALTVAVAEKALNKLFPVTQGLTNLIRKGLTKSFSALFGVLRGDKNTIAAIKQGFVDVRLAMAKTATSAYLLGLRIGGALTQLKTFISTFYKLAKAEGIIVAITELLPLLGAALDLALGPIGLIILGITAIGVAIFLLDKKFHFIRPTIEFFWKSLKNIFNWITDHWHLVVALLTGPIGIAVLLIIKHWQKIKDLFFGFGKLLIKFFVAPVYKYLISPFVEAQKFIINLWKKLPGILGEIIKKIPGVKQLLGIGKKVGGFFGGVAKAAVGVVGGAGGAVSRAADAAERGLGGSLQKKRTASNVLNNDVRDKRLIKKLRAKGLNDDDILDWLINHGAISKAGFRKRFGFPLTAVEGFSGGSPGVPGKGSKDTVPAMLTPGEWVLNSRQIKKLATLLGTSAEQARAMIFGTKMTGNPGVWGTAGGRKLKASKRHSPILGGSYSLIPQEDDDGNSVWFIQLADGTFGQVTARDAKKIEKSDGAFIPGYVKRNSHGFNQRIRTAMNPLGFANGGIVPAGIRGFAEGGIVQQPGYSGTSNAKTINQNFDIKTDGNSDWAYIMRLSSITAQSSF